jgi:serine protease inhibitor
MTKKILLIGLSVILFAGVATAVVLFIFPYRPTQPPRTNDTGSTEQGIQVVVKANNKFAFNLYSKLARYENGNIFYSPYSIFSALAMTYEGARGQTAEEIKSVFHFPEKNVLRSNFAAIYNEINKKSDAYELRTGNALWVQRDYQLLQDYINTVEKYYGGKAANVDFVRETEKSRQTINSFIEEQTNNKIKDLIPQGMLNPDTRLVLTNAIYFKGTWEWQFDKSLTREEDFKITPTNVVKTPMMYMEPERAEFNYADLGDLQILELPYKGDKISMLVLLPTGNLDTIESIITVEKLEQWKTKMRKEKLDAIYLPKFEFNTKYFMKKILRDMGMPSAFGGNADFSGMDGTKNLFIEEVIHQAFVKVDEEGTEAAGTTAVIIGETAYVPRKIFKADHPFIFIIQEKSTGNILFIGRVVDPTK